MISKLIEKIEKTKAPVCVGLDPVLSHIPEHILKKSYEKYGENPEGAAEAVWQFNRAIVDAVYDIIPAVKPQIAMYEEFGIPGLTVYERTVTYCQEKNLIVIGDAKRGDIGSTSAAYASAFLGEIKIGSKTFSAFHTDMVTVNPYLGTDGVKPFIDACNTFDKGIFVLDKTSNPSSGEFQDRELAGEPLYERVAEKIEEWGSLSMDGTYSNVGAVVGATYPEIGKKLREKMPHTFFLVPGYGAQGGTAEDLKHCFDKNGSGAIVNSSRGIIAAYQKEKYASFGPEHFADASRKALEDMIADIRSVL
jgi:orotidine-5'-phosphate decarboxylase